MWPYSDDEANWLTPPIPALQTPRKSVNDNDPHRRVTPVRAPSEAAPLSTRKTDPET